MELEAMKVEALQCYDVSQQGKKVLANSLLIKKKN